MKIFRCPNCAFTGDLGNECPRCGVVFAKYHPRAVRSFQETIQPDVSPEEVAVDNGPSPFRVAFRFVRWAMLATSAMFIYLVLVPSTPPLVDIDPTAEASTRDKLHAAERSLRKATNATIQLTEGEVNGWILANTGLNSPTDPTASATEFDPGSITREPAGKVDVTLPELRAHVTDMRVAFVENRVRTYLQFDLYGKQMSFDLEGYLSVRDGYLALDPIAGKLGSLPLPSLSLGAAARRVFESPENREKFRLPGDIEDMRVENGELVIQFGKKSPASPSAAASIR